MNAYIHKYFYPNLFGGYATARKHIVFSSLALNRYYKFIFRKEYKVQYCTFWMVKEMKKSIITVVGKDTVGIIAKVCTYLAENNINILDISQTIVQGYFNMMMIVDATSSAKQSGKIADELAELGEEIGVQIKLQQEDIFNSMHRI